MMLPAIPSGEFIVKVQRPMATTERVPQALVYDEGRTFYTTIPLYLVKRIFPKDADKVYYYAMFVAGTLSLDREAPPQDW